MKTDQCNIPYQQNETNRKTQSSQLMQKNHLTKFSILLWVCPMMKTLDKLGIEESNFNKIKPHKIYQTSYSMIKDWKLFFKDQEQDKDAHFHYFHWKQSMLCVFYWNNFFFFKKNDYLDSDLYYQVIANAHYLIQERCIMMGDNRFILCLRKPWNFHTGSQQIETHMKGLCWILGYWVNIGIILGYQDGDIYVCVCVCVCVCVYV